MADWYYVSNGQQLGPIAIDALRELAASGQLQAGDAVWTQGMPAWQPAGQTAGILAAGAPSSLPSGTIPYATPAPYLPPQPSIGDDAGVRWLLPVGRSGWAIAAGYLGLFSFVIFPAPLALICALLAIREIRRNPRRHGLGRAIFGLIMGVLGSIVLGIMVFALYVRR